MNNHPLTVAQILGAIQRHKFKAFFTWLLIMVATVALYLVWPRQYSSQGQLYVKMDRNNASVNPSTSGTQVSIQDTRETEIKSVAQIIGSRAVLDAVVDEVGADAILENGLLDFVPSLSLPKFGSESKGSGMSAAEFETLRKKELAVQRLYRSMEVSSEKKTSIIAVEVEANTRELAQQIVASIFENTRRVHMNIHAVSRSADFFDDQFEAQEKELVAAVDQLAKFRNERNVLSVAAARDTLQGIVSTIEQNILAVEVDLEEAKQRVAKLADLMDQTIDKIELPRKGVERLSYEDSRTEYFKLQSQREALLARYQPGHPEVVQIDEQLKLVKKTLDGMSEDRTESSMTTNPVYEAIEIDFLKASAELKANEARLASLQQKQSDTRAKLRELNEAEVQADQLQRNVEIARQYLGIYTQKRGESKAMELLDDRKISDVVVAQNATLAAKHASPKGSLVLPLGCLCGLIAGLGIALYSDRNHLSANLNESEVEEALEMPVLVTLPRVYSSRNMVN